MERKELIAQLDEVSNSNCKSCRFNSGSDPSSCRACPAYGELLSIGDKLIKISAERRKRKGIVEPKVKVKNNTGKRSGAKITVDQYLIYKKQNLSDEAIGKLIGATRAQVRHFKKANGLIKKKGVGSIG